MPATPAPSTIPAIAYPPALPITDRRGDILDAIRGNQVVVVAGETGSGKSTQLPKLCLELGRGVEGMIGHTQPRRLAARTVAARIAEELGTEVGDLVGYKVRFSDQVGDRTRVKLMTDGILLAELQGDRLLRSYDTLIVDEAHERSLNIDFILGYLGGLLPRRPDLKVVITSATIDTERFACHFGAPVVEVSGRSYPVEVRYRPLGDAADAARDQTDGIRMAVDELRAEGPGDILVFLSGEREIRDTAAALEDTGHQDAEILPLYARLSAAEQQRAFRPHRGRRIVLATNVAETSITVPGVRYVVDVGTARISRYNRRTKVQRLPIEPISRASADQRAGRCGRLAPGICVRLYGEDDFASRPEFTEPEILRTNLASVILQLAALGLGDVESFPFVDPPDRHAIRDAVALLAELGAMDVDRSLTRLGRRLARLPIDPRFGRMLLEADANDCVREVLVIVAGLSIQDPRERPTGQEQEADALHRRFADRDSDFVSLLNLWRYLEAEQRSRSSNEFRRLCRAEHLHHVRVREWQDLVRQLREVTHELGIRRRREAAAPDAIHRSLLAGLLSQVGTYDRATRDHLGARQAHFTIAPGSVLHRRSPRWVMAGELVETNRLWARMVAHIQPEWVEPLAAHLVRRSYGEPWWDPQRGAALTTERVTLYGLPIVADRRVQLARADAGLARTLFIEHGLVDGDWPGPERPGLGGARSGTAAGYAFLDRNRALIDDVRALEDRARRRDLLVTRDRLAAWFDARVPSDAVSGRNFDRWWRDARRRDPDLLTLTLPDLVDYSEAKAVDPGDFPTTWARGGLRLPLSYAYAPGADDDGITVHIPLVVLNQLDPGDFDWQVPGRRLELVTALIRSLPKAVRRGLAPAPERARQALDGVGPDDGALTPVLARRLSALAGASVAPGDLDPDGLPAHLRLRFRVEDGAGAELASGRDLPALQHRLAPAVRRAIARAVASVAPGLERSGLTAWDDDTLPRTVEASGDGLPVRGYPALVDEGTTAGVRVMATEAEQAWAMAAGTRRLLLLAVPGARGQVERRLRSAAALASLTRHYPGVAALTDDCLAAAADRIVSARGGPAWDHVAFRVLADAARDRLAPLAVGAAGQAADLVAGAQALEARLAATVAPALVPAADDMRSQLRRLLAPGFVARTGLGRLSDLRRYVEAVRLRLDKLGERPRRDRDLMLRVQVLEHEYDDLRAKSTSGGRRSRDEAALEGVGWLLEELRVSFFAQRLGTSRPVSEQRIRRALAAAAPRQ
jgi:ATP-dependent RNA helicase HrpA